MPRPTIASGSSLAYGRVIRKRSAGAAEFTKVYACASREASRRLLNRGLWLSDPGHRSVGLT